VVKGDENVADFGVPDETVEAAIDYVNPIVFSKTGAPTPGVPDGRV